MASSDPNQLAALRRLFEACKNEENSHRKAATEVKRADLKPLFQGWAEQWGRYAAEWQGELARLGSHDQRESGTLVETLKQGWAEIASAVTGGDETWVAECARSAEAARKEFEEVLKEDLPADVKEKARRQLVGVQEAEDRIRGISAQ